MRHQYIFAALLVLVLLVGCSANRNTALVDVRLNASSQQLLAANATGSMPIASWLETQSQQSLVETQAHYLIKAQQASTPKESQEWLDLAAQVSGSGGSTMATLVNASSYRMTILDGPYAGTTLEPGQSSSPARVPVGVVNFRALSASSIGQDFYVDVIRKVSAGDKTIVLVNKTR
ncbi:hypothetical protein EOM71_00825 [Candidatus Falkowbacteria bacterium]|nr:hypothetical protein [Candidatus Falkowbacteria bacterium]